MNQFRIMSSPVWIPLSRVNYCAYLIHPVILTVYFTSLEQPFHITGMTVAFLTAATIVRCRPVAWITHLTCTQTFTYLAAAVLVLFVEAPLGQLEKLLLGG